MATPPTISKSPLAAAPVPAASLHPLGSLRPVTGAPAAPSPGWLAPASGSPSWTPAIHPYGLSASLPFAPNPGSGGAGTLSPFSKATPPPSAPPPPVMPLGHWAQSPAPAPLTPAHPGEGLTPLPQPFTLSPLFCFPTPIALGALGTSSAGSGLIPGASLGPLEHDSPNPQTHMRSLGRQAVPSNRDCELDAGLSHVVLNLDKEIWSPSRRGLLLQLVMGLPRLRRRTIHLTGLLRT
jgi:hypothetical protein